jgi:hypothetical protein
MPANEVHGRIVVVDGRYRFRTMTLTAGDSGAYRMEVAGLFRMALDAGASFVKIESAMGVRQAGAGTHRGRGAPEWDKAPLDPRRFQDSPGATRADFVAFVIPGGHPLAITIDFRGNLFLG